MTSTGKIFFLLLFFAGLMSSSRCLSTTGKQVNSNGVEEQKGPGNSLVSTYKQSCGQCHIPYPPDFLPSGSWEKLLGSTEKHFGESLDIDQKDKDIIATYLKENGAESSKSRISQKIMQSLDGKTPLRLTEIPYIIKKHRKYSPDVLKRKSIGSLAQCNACHQSADKWKF